MSGTGSDAVLTRRAAISAVAVLLAAPVMAQAREIDLVLPGVAFNAGMREFAAGFAEETGVKANLRLQGMGRILDVIRSDPRPADVVFLPTGLMDTLEKEGGIRPGSRLEIGRVDVGLAVHKGDPIPDISTVDRLAAVLKAADSVAYSNPASGSMEARIIDDMLKRPEFAGVKRKISTNGEGGEALVRGEAQIALQLICEVVNHPELASAGPLPSELGAWIEVAGAVSARAAHPQEGQRFLAYVTQPGTYSLWRARGLVRPKLATPGSL